jgi:hypothetical protein
MLREELQESLRRVLGILERAAVVTNIENRLRRERSHGASSADILGAYSTISRWWDSASEGERRLVEIFELDPLFDVRWWSGLLAADSEEGLSAAFHVSSRITFVQRELPRVLALLETEASKIKAETIADAPHGTEAEEVLELRIIEEHHERSRPHRIISAIESVTMLYEVAAELDNVPSNTLTIIGCDSGSDKEFDFLGFANAVRAIKDTILALWDRVVFFRERKMHAGFELLSESLPLIERIDQMNGSVLSPEQCELMKRKVLGGVQRFLDAGCTIPEIDKATQFSPRALLAPSPKLLAPPVGQAEPIVLAQQNQIDVNDSGMEDVPDVFSNLTPEQIRAIESILRTREISSAPGAESDQGQEPDDTASETDADRSPGE